MRRGLSGRALVVAVAVVTAAAGLAACGRDGEDAAGGDDDGGSATTAAPVTTAPDEAAGSFGDLGAVCGPAPEGADLAATDTGVTASSIQIGTVSDPGFSGRPGLNQELFDTAQAFSQWCNEAGGINGRRIEVVERDAKLTEHQGRMIDACEGGDFMLVGGGGVFDDQGQQERLACGLPNIPGYVVTPTAIESDLLIQPLPNPVAQLPIGDFRWLEEQYPDAVDHIGLLVLGVNATAIVADRTIEAIEALGWTVVYNEQYNAAGETSWRGFAEGLKSAGARGVIWLGEPVNLAAVRRAMDEVEYHPDFVRTDANHYDPLLLSEGGRAVNGTYIRTTAHPFLDPEQAAGNPATAQYLDILDRYDPSGKVAYLGLMSFSAWLLFARAASACGADLTRDCVWEEAGSITEWTGGGLHARQNLRARAASECFLMLEARDGEFVAADIEPNEGAYRCDADGVMTLDGDYGEGARCENPAFAGDPRPSTCAP